MATIVNARDVILQAASPRVGSATLPSNVTIPKTQVTGLGTLAGQNTVDLASQVVGYLSSGNVTGLGALAALSSVNLSSAYVVGSLAADKIGAGSLAAGVVYAGSVSADQITTGTMTSVSINTSGFVRAYGTYPSGVTLANGSTVYPTVYGRTTASASGYPAVLAEATASNGNGVCAIATSGNAVYAYATTGAGIYSYSNSGTAMFGLAGSSSGIGVYAQNSFGGTALYVNGSMAITSTSVVGNLNADMLDGNHASAFAVSGHTHSQYVQIAGGATNGSYLYFVDTSAPSNQSTRAGWLKIANNGGTTVWIPFYI